MMSANRWMTYLAEAYPQIPWALIAAGLAVSGNKLSGKPLNLTYILVIFAALWIFFLVVRLILDRQTLEKDRLANPKKSLPRGILSVPEVSTAINGLQLFLIGFAVLIAIAIHFTTGLWLILLVAYTWLLEKYFFVPKLIAGYPFFQILFHQLYAWPLAYFVISAHIETDSSYYILISWLFGTLLFSALCIYELSRQLNPQSHPIQATALNFYGYKAVFAFACFFLFTSLMCALLLNLSAILLPLVISLFISFVILFFNHRLFYVTKFAAEISLIAHSWAATFF